MFIIYQDFESLFFKLSDRKESLKNVKLLGSLQRDPRFICPDTKYSVTIDTSDCRCLGQNDFVYLMFVINWRAYGSIRVATKILNYISFWVNFFSENPASTV